VNSKLVRFCRLSIEKWKIRFLKAESNAVTTYTDMMRNIPGGLSFAITLTALTHELNRADCGYQIHKTERKISLLLYMVDLKVLVRNEDELGNEIKI
jgi:hypothetical protein